jgi:hypothetical protein
MTTIILLVEVIILTSGELANYLGIKETYLRSHWQEIIKSNARAGVELYKRGRGATAAYGIKGWGMTEVCWDYEELK